MSWKLGMRIPVKMREQGIEYAAGRAAGIGFDVLDVGQLTKETKDTLLRHGLGIGSVDGQGVRQLLSRDESRREAAIAGIKQQMTVMAALEESVMFMCLVPEEAELPKREAFAIWKESFADIVKHAEHIGVKIAIEGWPGRSPHYPTLGATPEMLRAMFEAIPSAQFGWNYDPSHLVRLGIDYLRALSEFGERVVHCHGKDTEMLPEHQYEYGNLPPVFGSPYEESEGAWRYTIPGHGDIEWGKIAVRLDRFAYRGAISVELEDHRFRGSLEREEAGLIKALEHLNLYFK